MRTQHTLAALVLAGFAGSALNAGTDAEALAEATYATVVDAHGAVSLPRSYRERWAHLGSWVVADADAPGHGFHDVYTQPVAAATWRHTGEFPDGTVLVKEIRAIGRGAMTTGEALWARDTNLWFVMVRDTQGRFPAHPDWAEGWGWALFEAADPAVEVSPGFAEGCRGCHLPARDTGWVFVEGYPAPHPGSAAISAAMQAR